MPRRKTFPIDPDTKARIWALIPEGKFAPNSNLQKILDRDDHCVNAKQYAHWCIDFVLKRIRPDLGFDVVELFGYTPRHLNGDVVEQGLYNAKADGKWYCTHPNKIKRDLGKTLPLHRELQRIFCQCGSECPSDMVNRHIKRFKPRIKKGERDEVGCGCANWTHTLVGTRSQNSVDLMRCEGGRQLIGFKANEMNANTRTLNAQVFTLRTEIWDLAMMPRGGPLDEERASLRDITQVQRRTWKPSDPRWRCYDTWRRSRNNYPLIKARADEIGVTVETIQNYLSQRTFKCVARDRSLKPYDLGTEVLNSQRTLFRAEIKIARKLVDEIPRAYNIPALVADAEEWLGKPEVDDQDIQVNGPSKSVFMVVFRTVRRNLNRNAVPGHPYKSGQRDNFVRPDNVKALVRRSQCMAIGLLAPMIRQWIEHRDEVNGRLQHCLAIGRKQWRRLACKVEELIQHEPPSEPSSKRRRIVQ